MDNPTYFETNKNSWNERTKKHVDSKFYDVNGFKSGANPLNKIEMNLIGPVSGKSLLHLQCHFGLDTLSWERLGATVVGIDISDEAIAKAKALTSELNMKADFVCCNVLETRNFVSDEFDIVFTSYGTVTWLPDLTPWAEVVNKSLKSGGKFVIVEFHPMMWSLDDNFEKLGYDYFNRGANHEVEGGTYADDFGELRVDSYWWNHPISEVISSLRKQGLSLESMDEYDYSAYDCLPNMKSVGHRRFHLNKLGSTIPYMYSMVWTKP